MDPMPAFSGCFIRQGRSNTAYPARRQRWQEAVAKRLHRVGHLLLGDVQSLSKRSSSVQAGWAQLLKGWLMLPCWAAWFV